MFLAGEVSPHESLDKDNTSKNWDPKCDIARQGPEPSSVYYVARFKTDPPRDLFVDKKCPISQ